MESRQPHEGSTPDECRYFLEMTAESELLPSTRDHGHIEIRQQKVPDIQLSRYLYHAVGNEYHWTVRIPWTGEQWLEHLSLDNVEMWIAYSEEVVAGYFELFKDDEGNVELAYFGLLPRFTGRGIGGYLLTEAIRRAWQMGASRVWLHTSTRDHAHALANYRAWGFRVFKQEAVVPPSNQ